MVTYNAITMIRCICLTRAHVSLTHKTKIMQLVMLPRYCKDLHYNTLAHSNYTQKKRPFGDDLRTVTIELLFYFCTILML